MTSRLWPRASGHQGDERQAALLRTPAGRVFCGMMTAGDPIQPVAFLNSLLI